LLKASPAIVLFETNVAFARRKSVAASLEYPEKAICLPYYV
jgi:hypothetical protein